MVDAGKRYRAFISYSQQDADWGKRLHRWLETYRVPLGAQVDVQLPRRLGRFFRDEEEMSAASNIAELVRLAIEDAESLIVVCSPRSAQSKWVNAEIHHFRRTGRGRRVFAFIIDGIPNSGDPATECFPPALRAAGDPDDPDALPIEPLGLDIRKDGRAKACARLAAGLLSIDFDNLWQRERRRTETQQRWITGGLAATTLAFAGLATAAVAFGLQSQRRAAILSIETARAVLAEGDADAAALVLLEAAKAIPPQETPDSLLIGFDEVLQRASIETTYVLPPDARLFDAPEGLFIFDPAAKTISLLDSSGPPNVIAPAIATPAFIGQAADGALITVGDDFTITRIVNQVAEQIGRLAPQALTADVYSRVKPISLSPDGVLLIQPPATGAGGGGNAQLFDLATRTLSQVPVKGSGQVFYLRREDGARFVFSSAGGYPCADCIAPLDLPRPRTLPGFNALLSEWCLGDTELEAVARRQFEREIGAAMATECDSGTGDVLVSQTQRTSRAPLFTRRLFNTFTSSYQPIVDVLASRIASDAAFAPPPLRGTWTRNLVIMQLDANALAVVSGRDLLVSEPERPLLELRMPGLIERIRLMANRRIAVVEENAGLVRVIDYGAAGSFGMHASSDASSMAGARTEVEPCPAQVRQVGGRETTFAFAAPEGAARRLVARQGDKVLATHLADDLPQRCAIISEDGRYLALFGADGSARILNATRPEVGVIASIPGADAIAFLPDNRGVVVQTAERFDLWERAFASPLKFVRTLYTLRPGESSAELDAAGQRLLITRELDICAAGALCDFRASASAVVLYSLSAQRVFRQIAAGSRFYDQPAGFTADGDAYFGEGDDARIYRAPGPAEVVSATRATLSDRCATFPGEDYRASPCWPTTFAGD